MPAQQDDVNPYEMGSLPNHVRAICPDCERVVVKDTEEEAEEVVEDHNENFHDGEEASSVCAWDTLDEEINVDIGEAHERKGLFMVAAGRSEYGMLDPDDDHTEHDAVEVVEG